MSIFGQLLRVHYAERLIETRWKKIANTCAFLARVDIDRLLLLRYRMHSFLRKYQSFLFLEVIDRCSRNFEQALKELNFSSIQERHLAMLRDIAARGLIAPSSGKEAVDQFFVHVLELTGIVDC